MPFTFSHPAIVLPLNYLHKKWLSLTGLVVGSIVPDFEYFINMKAERKYGHTIAGLFWFDLPLAIVICFVFHGMVRNALTNHLPAPLQKRFAAYKYFNWNRHFKKNAVYVLISILIGAASHLFWDSFTNENGFFVEHISFLRQTFRTPYTAVTISSVVSWICSLAGAIVVVYAVWQLPVQKKAVVHKKFLGYWLLVVLIAAVAITIRLHFEPNTRMFIYWHLFIANYILIATAAFLLALLLASALFTLKSLTSSLRGARIDSK